MTLLEKSNDLKPAEISETNYVTNSSPKTTPDSDATSITQTFVIQQIPEKSSENKNKSGSNISPLAKSLLDPSPKSPVTQVVVDEEEHNTLDFGKYVFVDPNTGDIQVMRNRSKSLDSLVSMTSNRSSLSRFGSFEFVTDYEIVIAEKNQQNAM